MNKIRIIQAVNQIGLGGTEYALQLFSKFLDKKRFEVIVVGLLHGGERVELIRDLGIPVILLNNDLVQLAELLKSTDVFHWHGNGLLDRSLFEVIKANRPKLVIQTNVFGLYEQSPYYDLVDYDLYISKMILVRRMALDRKLANLYPEKRKVLPYPVDVDHITKILPSTAEIANFGTQYKLENYFIVGRIGRADDNKFDLITLDGFAEFARNKSDARFLILGITPKIEAHAASLGISDKMIIFPNTSDLKQLLYYYKSMHVFLAASNIGESFGMVIAEAMTAGTAVVTVSNEDRDNAQVELINNEESGLAVKRDKKKIASAISFFYENRALAKEFGVAANAKIKNDYQADKIVRSLEYLIFKHLKIPFKYYQDEQSLVVDYSKELVNDYIKRCVNLFGRSTLLKKLLWQIRRK